jgi:dipeptidyl aminopeptidase/acylaminoacyl peptidase
MKIIATILTTIILCAGISVNGEPIEGEKLFINPQNSMVLFSPDGKYVSYYMYDKKGQYITLNDLRTKSMAAQFALGNDVTLNDYFWLNSSQIFISVEKGLNNEKNLIGEFKNGQIYLRLIESDGYLVHILPDQPEMVMFAKKRGQYDYRLDLYIIEIEALINNNFSNAQKIKNIGSDVNYFFYDYDFKRLIASEYDEDKKTIILKYMPIEGGKWHPLLKLEDTDYILKPVGFITKDKLGVLTNKESDKIVLREFDIKSQTLGKIVYQHPTYDLTSAGFLPDGKLDYVRFKQHGLNRTLYFDKGTERFAKRLTKTFTNQEVYFADRALNDQLLMLYVNGSDQPGEYFVYDSRTDTATRLLCSYPDLLDCTFASSELIKLKTADGTEIEAFLTVPRDIDHSTLLVMPHGGPIEIQESDRFNKEVQYFASRGFSVLRVNFRGSSGFGKAFREKGVGEFGRLIEEDITAAVDHVLQTRKFKNICAIGSSYGGYSAAMLAIKQPERYKCVVGAFGVYDLPLLFNASNLRSTEEYRKIVARTVGEFSEDLRLYSPVYLSKGLKAPILLLAGREDDTADFEHSNRFKYVLKHNNHPVETFFYQDQAHGYDTWQGDMHGAALTYDFLMRILKLPDPDKQHLVKSGKKALADDYAIIADGFEFEYEQEKNTDKSLNYYKKASEFDHGRSIFNIGASYHSGDGVEKDLDKAVEYYLKSKKQEYDGAYRRLGRMYMEGEYFKQDWQKAYSSLTKAKELDDTPPNNIMLARFYCTAPDGLRDINRCVDLLDIDQYKDKSKTTASKAIEEILTSGSWVITEGKYTADEYKNIKETIKKALTITQVKISLDIQKEGEFKFKEGEKFGEDDKYELLDNSFKIKAKDDKDDCFGIIFKVDVPGINSYADKVAVVARWVQVNFEGKQKIFDSKILYGVPINEWHMFAKYKDIEESGTWRLEIYDLDQNQLYSREFQVVPLEKNKEKTAI